MTNVNEVKLKDKNAKITCESIEEFLCVAWDVAKDRSVDAAAASVDIFTFFTPSIFDSVSDTLFLAPDDSGLIKFEDSESVAFGFTSDTRAELVGEGFFVADIPLFLIRLGPASTEEKTKQELCSK